MAFFISFLRMAFLFLNGELLPATDPVLTAQNRGFRYGDGLFETMKVQQGKIVLEPFHFDRLFQGLNLLQIEANTISQKLIVSQVGQLLQANNCHDSARVRLAVFRDENNRAAYIIEAFVLDKKVNTLNEKGWKIELYPHVRKSCDAFSNIKSANYLPYVMADLFAKENALDESIVLNTENNLCDASKANIFLVIKNEVYTPALHQGCVNGVKRRYLINELKKIVQVHQQAITVQMLEDAQEVFLSNAINDIRWVQWFRQIEYANRFVSSVYHQLFASTYK
jgi:branched-chain amino acid aminotransferase